jgi:hypothetical protein
MTSKTLGITSKDATFSANPGRTLAAHATATSKTQPFVRRRLKALDLRVLFAVKTITH